METNANGITQTAPTTPPDSITKRVKHFAFGTIATLLCLLIVFGALELTYRSLTIRDTSLDWLKWHPTRLYINNPNLPDVYWDTEWNVNREGFRGPLPGMKSKPRILSLGDSSTFGYKVDYDRSYPRRLEILRPEYQVINAGTFGYSSYQGRVVFEEEWQRLQPDVVTLAFGFNDRRYVTGRNQVDNKANLHRLYRQYSWQSFFCQSRFYESLINYRRSTRTVTPPPITTLMPRVNTLEYRNNIESVVKTCLANNIQPVLIYTGEHPGLHADLHKGIDALDRRQFESALAYFEKAREGKGEDARVMGTYYKVLTLQLLGRFEEADSIQCDYPYAYYFPGINPIRTSHSYVQALRELSGRYAIPLIEFRKLIHDDSSFYIDECHPSEEGYRWIAEALAGVIR